MKSAFLRIRRRLLVLALAPFVLVESGQAALLVDTPVPPATSVIEREMGDDVRRINAISEKMSDGIPVSEGDMKFMSDMVKRGEVPEFQFSGGRTLADVNNHNLERADLIEKTQQSLLDGGTRSGDDPTRKSIQDRLDELLDTGAEADRLRNVAGNKDARAKEVLADAERIRNLPNEHQAMADRTRQQIQDLQRQGNLSPEQLERLERLRSVLSSREQRARETDERRRSMIERREDDAARLRDEADEMRERAGRIEKDGFTDQEVKRRIERAVDRALGERDADLPRNKADFATMNQQQEQAARLKAEADRARAEGRIDEAERLERESHSLALNILSKFNVAMILFADGKGGSSADLALFLSRNPDWHINTDPNTVFTTWDPNNNPTSTWGAAGDDVLTPPGSSFDVSWDSPVDGQSAGDPGFFGITPIGSMEGLPSIVTDSVDPNFAFDNENPIVAGLFPPGTGGDDRLGHGTDTLIGRPYGGGDDWLGSGSGTVGNHDPDGLFGGDSLSGFHDVEWQPGSTQNWIFWRDTTVMGPNSIGGVFDPSGGGGATSSGMPAGTGGGGDPVTTGGFYAGSVTMDRSTGPLGDYYSSPVGSTFPGWLNVGGGGLMPGAITIHHISASIPGGLGLGPSGAGALPAALPGTFTGPIGISGSPNFLLLPGGTVYVDNFSLILGPASAPLATLPDGGAEVSQP